MNQKRRIEPQSKDKFKKQRIQLTNKKGKQNDGMVNDDELIDFLNVGAENKESSYLKETVQKKVLIF